MTVYLSADQDLTVNGLSLHTVAIGVETKTGRLNVPGLRGTNLVVPGRSGSIWTPNKPFEEGRVVLSMFILGCDDDGE